MIPNLDNIILVYTESFAKGPDYTL